MTETTTPVSSYLTGAVNFENGTLKELVVFRTGPLEPELEAMGYMEESYVASVETVIKDLKGGAEFGASFDGAPVLYPLEIVIREGKETLEVADVGQPEEFRTLRGLPAITTEEEQAWILVFYDRYQELGQGRVAYGELSDVSRKSYATHGDKDPAAAAREVFQEKHAQDLA